MQKQPSFRQETPVEEAGHIAKLIENIEKVFIGKKAAIKLILTGLFAGGHMLIEDVPGVGKTVLARALARSIDCLFQRIQFTPDLLPSDIIGVSIYTPKMEEFVFKAGPIFANVILADEINRTTPRTQSSLLEAMNEFQVSIDGKTRKLELPFIVLATQNPYEFEGTYPLPESQLDRFLMRIEIGYPDMEHEKLVLFSQTHEHPLDNLSPVLDRNEVVSLQQKVKEVRVDDSIIKYILDITRKTRSNSKLEIGVSPRGSLMLRRAVQARALVEGRDYVVPDDIKKLAVPVLSHRVLIRATARQDARRAAVVIKEIVEEVPVPI
jgi:MoxR-like ATPase